MATDCTKVLYFPPRLAGITPCRITQNRSSVTPTSRTRITMVTHHGSSSRIDSPTRAVPVSALSAIGSASLPTSVTSPRRRARSPSTRSVREATANTANAVNRQPSLSPPSWNSAAANTGTSSSRSRVSPLATFATRTVRGGVAAGSGTTAPIGSGPARAGELDRPDRVHGRLVHRGEIDAGAAGDGGPDQVADPRALRQAGQRGAAVHLRRLVRGPALRLGAVDGLHQHL